jgi:multidrug efflux system membrane fusion protein
MKVKPRQITIGSIGIFIVALLTLTFLGACQNGADKDDADRQAQAKKGPAQISVENGQTVLTLDTPTQKRLGLEVAILTTTVTRAQVTSPAVVLPVQDLAAFRNSYTATQTQLQKLHVELDVARKEYARLKALFEQDHNVSEKSLQSAEGTLKANEADERAGEQQRNLQESMVRQEWGSVVSKWVLDDSPEFQHILNQRDVIVQVTMQADATFGAPKTISLEIPGTTRIGASLVSSFPRVDPRIQGRSFLYTAPGHLGLTPGVNLLAHLSIGSQMRGLIVPTSAVVWSEGKAWVYQQTASDRFTRRVVPTEAPVERGFFAAQGFAPGDKVVTRGAQALLSEEMLLHGQSGGETDEN